MAQQARDYSLEDLITLMTISHLTKLKVGNIELEMSPSGFQASESEAEESEPDDLRVCACGHAILTDHNEHGCLHGCNIGVCAPEQPTAEA